MPKQLPNGTAGRLADLWQFPLASDVLLTMQFWGRGPTRADLAHLERILALAASAVMAEPPTPHDGPRPEEG